MASPIDIRELKTLANLLYKTGIDTIWFEQGAGTTIYGKAIDPSHIVLVEIELLLSEALAENGYMIRIDTYKLYEAVRRTPPSKRTVLIDVRHNKVYVGGVEAYVGWVEVGFTCSREEAEKKYGYEEFPELKLEPTGRITVSLGGEFRALLRKLQQAGLTSIMLAVDSKGVYLGIPKLNKGWLVFDITNSTLGVTVDWVTEKSVTGLGTNILLEVLPPPKFLGKGESLAVTFTGTFKPVKITYGLFTGTVNIWVAPQIFEEEFLELEKADLESIAISSSPITNNYDAVYIVDNKVVPLLVVLMKNLYDTYLRLEEDEITVYAVNPARTVAVKHVSSYSNGLLLNTLINKIPSKYYSVGIDHHYLDALGEILKHILAPFQVEVKNDKLYFLTVIAGEAGGKDAVELIAEAFSKYEDKIVWTTPIQLRYFRKWVSKATGYLVIDDLGRVYDYHNGLKHLWGVSEGKPKYYVSIDASTLKEEILPLLPNEFELAFVQVEKGEPSCMAYIRGDNIEIAVAGEILEKKAISELMGSPEEKLLREVDEAIKEMEEMLRG